MIKLDEHFARVRPPFPNATTTASRLRTAALEPALERLRLARDRETIAWLVAESGCGKSTVLFELAQSLDAANYTVVSVSLTTVPSSSFIAQLLAAMGLPSNRGTKAETAIALVRHFRAVAKSTMSC